MPASEPNRSQNCLSADEPSAAGVIGPDSEQTFRKCLSAVIIAVEKCQASANQLGCQWGSTLVALNRSSIVGECSADISSARNYGSFPLARLTRFSKIVVGEEASVSLKPIARMDLIEVGSNKFLSQFLVLVAKERNLWPDELREPDRRVWHRQC
jgi:hypothetical protein